MEQNEEVFKCQLYLSGKQLFRLNRCYGKVDVIVTDSPIILGNVYNNENPYLKDALLYEFNKYNNLNIFLKRVKKYNSNGRFQTEEESNNISKEILNMLLQNDIVFECYEGSTLGYDIIIDRIKGSL